MMLTKFRPAHTMTPYNRPPQKRSAYKFGLLCIHRIGKGSPKVWTISHRATGRTLGVYAYRALPLIAVARALAVDPVWGDPRSDIEWAIYITKRALHHHGGGKVFTVGRVSQ